MMVQNQFQDVESHLRVLRPIHWLRWKEWSPAALPQRTRGRYASDYTSSWKRPRWSWRTAAVIYRQPIFSQKNLQLWLQDVAREHELDNSQGGRVISRFFRIFITISLSYPAAFRLPKTNSEVTRKKCPESVCCEARVANYGRGTTGISRPQWISQKKSGRGWCPDWNCPESVGENIDPMGEFPQQTHQPMHTDTRTDPGTCTESPLQNQPRIWANAVGKQCWRMDPHGFFGHYLPSGTPT